MSFAGDGSSPSRADLLAWVGRAGRAVAAYYGGYPVERVDLTIRTGRGGGITGGRTFGDRGRAAIVITAGQDTTAADLASNWVLVHEMVHLAFPSMTGHEWIEEGLATYVEPLARARAGLIAPDEVWRWLLWGLPKGVEGMGSRGLDDAGGWGATYWGGAVFCFLADVQIRERTGNRRSLDDALRGIVRAGGNVTVSWPIERALGGGRPRDGDTGALRAVREDGGGADEGRPAGALEEPRRVVFRRAHRLRRRGAARGGAQGDDLGEIGRPQGPPSRSAH